MAETQKLYLGDDEIGITRFGEDGNLIRGAFPFSLGIDYLVVAGGGSGGIGNGTVSGGTLGGGGGAGGLRSGSYSLSISDTVSAVVGNGGSGDETDGNDSSFIGSGISTTSTGGGFGGSINGTGDGSDGGSGGGAAYFGYSPGSGITGQGHSGNTGRNTTNGHTGGSGGGAGSAPPSQTQSGAGSTWLDSTLYAKGGPGAFCSGLSTQPGSGGQGSASGVTRTDGIKGIVKLRYPGNQKATGGTITQDGGYTYHTFTSNGTFTVTG